MGAKLKSGDESVLEDILICYGPRIGKILLSKYNSILFCQEDIDDILANALHRLWISRDLYDPDKSSLRRWFYVIAHHFTIDQYKCGWQKMKAIEAKRGVQADVKTLEDDDSNARDETVYISRKQRDIAEIVASLPDVDRVIVNAHACAEDGEHWAANLAAEIGMESGTIRTRLWRIHERIESEMNRRGHNLKRMKKSPTRTFPTDNPAGIRGGSLDD